MYNGIGLETPRGSGTNGYIQTNKFFVKSKTGQVTHKIKGFQADQGTFGITTKPNMEILEHDCKRQIELKLVVLEDKLIEQGYTDSEIKEKVDEARKTLEAAAASEESGGPSSLVVFRNKVKDVFYSFVLFCLYCCYSITVLFVVHFVIELCNHSY